MYGLMYYERGNRAMQGEVAPYNIKDPMKEAIELFEHTLDKKALVSTAQS